MLTVTIPTDHIAHHLDRAENAADHAVILPAGKTLAAVLRGLADEVERTISIVPWPGNDEWVPEAWSCDLSAEHVGIVTASVVLDTDPIL